jgi:hypothetical protein
LYFQGSRDIYRYTDDFEELAVMAGYSDTLVWVTKYRSGLDPKINVAITTSGTAPDLTDYNGWSARAFRQYEAFGWAGSGNPLVRLLAAYNGNIPCTCYGLVRAGSWTHAPSGHSNVC